MTRLLIIFTLLFAPLAFADEPASGQIPPKVTPLPPDVQAQMEETPPPESIVIPYQVWADHLRAWRALEQYVAMDRWQLLQEAQRSEQALQSSATNQFAHPSAEPKPKAKRKP